MKATEAAIPRPLELEPDCDEALPLACVDSEEELGKVDELPVLLLAPALVAESGLRCAAASWSEDLLSSAAPEALALVSTELAMRE